MTALPTTLLVGHPRRGSRTLAVAHSAAETLRTALTAQGVAVAQPDLVDLAGPDDAPPGWLVSGVRNHQEAVRARDLVSRRGLLIVVSPTFKGAYSGLLKVFFDMLPIDGLADAVAVSLMTAGWPEHRAVADTHLRALLVELAAVTPVRGFGVLEADFGDLDTVLTGWAERAAPAVAGVLSRLYASPAGLSDHATTDALQEVVR